MNVAENQGSYLFQCFESPEEPHLVKKPAEQRIVDLLVSSGCKLFCIEVEQISTDSPATLEDSQDKIQKALIDEAKGDKHIIDHAFQEELGYLVRDVRQYVSLERQKRETKNATLKKPAAPKPLSQRLRGLF